MDRKLDGSLVAKSCSSALCCAQMSHQTHLHPSPDRGRLMVMDSFYTRHVLARQFSQLSDEECRVLGTVRFTNNDDLNSLALREATESLTNAYRGEWRLVQVYHKEMNTSNVAAVADKTGFLVFKDRSIVSFYTNDLVDTPRLRIHNNH